MADSETPEDMLERFKAHRQRGIDNLELCAQLAASPIQRDQEMAALQAPIWEKFVADWDRTIARLERDIAEGRA